MYRDLGFIRVAGRHTRRGSRPRRSPAYAYLVYPHKPIVAYLPSTGRLLSEYCVEFPDMSGAGGPARLPASDDVLAKWMALTSDEDRVIRRANMHLVGASSIPRGCAATSGASRSGSGGASAAASCPQALSEPRSPQSEPGDPRRPGPGPGARVPEGRGLRRRGAQPPDRRHRQHLDRDDALQLPPAPAGGEGEGGRARGGRHADGVQHRRDLGRHHDGHRGHARLAGEPGGDRRLDRAGGARPHVRRGDRPLRLRQDDSRLRDGAGAARHAEPHALRRLDRARALARQGRDDPGCVRRHRRARRR